MALLNRLFSSRRKPFAKAQDNASEKLFTFSNDQVRVIVFRECDFRGRKLLFDSKTVRKESLVETQNGQPEQDPKKYVEKTGGHAYSYTKPCSDVSRLGEMIFGSVAMSFRGTTYKIHSIQVPPQLVCSQVFPSPKNPVRMRRSAPSHVHTGSSIEHSIRLDDSGASSATSGSDQSVLSGASDTILVCKRQHSIPLDVPASFSLVSSSGYGEEHSCSSVSSGPQSIPVDLSQGVHSGDSLSKRWPCWSMSGSMDPSAGSLPGSASTEDSFHKVRSSKIGLAVLIELTDGEEEKLEQFLMEHAALIEMMMWRVRRGVEGAYLRHNTFVSTMHTISTQTARWLFDLLTGARNFVQTWHSHFPNCDNLFSIIEKSPSVSFLGHLTGSSPQRTFLHTDNRDAIRFSTLTSGGGLFSSFKSDNCVFDSSGEFNFVNISRFLKHDGASGRKDESLLLAEKFVKEFCELLESVDVKQTNFFISTLVTAVLTHHLGWVNTVLPMALKQNQPHSMNPFWSQFTELYGAIGHPLKMSRTVISGSQNTELVPKVLNALKYFIRCSEVSRYYKSRVGVDFENANADSICSAKSCIPKENYKKYEDHLREIEAFTKAENQQPGFKLKMPITKKKAEEETAAYTNEENFIKAQKKLSLVKTHTCLNELDKLCEYQEKEKHTDILDKVTNLGLQAINTADEIDVACRFLQNINTDVQQLVDINEAKQEIERVFSPKKKLSENKFPCQLEKNENGNSALTQKLSLNMPNEENGNTHTIPKLPDEANPLNPDIEKDAVVFVLGEDEKLVGIKRELTPTKLCFKPETMLIDNSPPEVFPISIRVDFLSQYLDHNSNQHDIGTGLKKSKTYSKEPATSSIEFSNPSTTDEDNSKVPIFSALIDKPTHNSEIIRRNESSDDLKILPDNTSVKSTNEEKEPFLIGLKKSNTVCKELSDVIVGLKKSKTVGKELSDVTVGLKKSRTVGKELSYVTVGLKKSKTVCEELSDVTVGLKKSTTVCKELGSFELEQNEGNVEKNIELIEKNPPRLRKSNTVCHEFHTEILETKNVSNQVVENENNNNNIPLSTTITKNVFENKENELIIANITKEKCLGLRKSQTVGKELNIAAPNKVKSLTDLNTKTPYKHCPLDKIQFPKCNIPKRKQIEDISLGSDSLEKSEKHITCIPITSTNIYHKEVINNIDDSELKFSGSVKKTSKKYKKSKYYDSADSSMKESKSNLDIPIFESANLLEDHNLGNSSNLTIQPNDAFKIRRGASFSKTLEVADGEELAVSIQNYEKSENLLYDTTPFKETDFTQCLEGAYIKPSISFDQIQLVSSKSKPVRAASEPPITEKASPSTSTRYKYSAVKFNFQQYPQIVENYMKNKNIELSNMQFSEKKLDSLWQSSSTFDTYKSEEGADDFDGGEALTTPSNASELEFTSELVVEKVEEKRAEVLEEQASKRLEFNRNVVPNTVIKEPNQYGHSKVWKDAKNRRKSDERMVNNLKVVEIPMPKSADMESHFRSIDYNNTLIRGLDNHYVSDMVLQGTTAPKNEWEQTLKKDLLLSTQHTFSNQQVEESLAIVANTDTWEVQLMSSHTYVIDRSSAGVPVGMSQLVANMLETLLHMWRLHTPAEYCLMHIEQQLQEFCLRSKALAQFLLDTDFCSMEILTSTLRLEVNDVPLLMAIASTHTPQVTQKYGLSFQ